MQEHDWLVRQFETSRTHLAKVAFRMLGSEIEAEDAVQETWLRLSRSNTEVIDNLAGWLTTVVARICLDMLRSRRARRAASLDVRDTAQLADKTTADPEHEAVLADSIGPALLVVLDLLSPPERVAFVLHDMFGMPFDEVGPIVGRSVDASRQLASRARRRVRGSRVSDAARQESGDGRPPDSPGLDREGRRNAERRMVDAFLAAARGGDFEGLLALLDPGCVVRSDQYAALLGSPKRIEGGREVADFFNGAASAAVRATIDGIAGAAWAPNGRVRVAFNFSFTEDRIRGIDLIADSVRLQELGVELPDS